MSTTLILPGLYSSGPDHWQTWFEEEIPGTVRVIQGDWAKPDLAEWSRRVRRDMARTPGRLYLVAHSFGVLAGVHAALAATDRIAGALLVAPADPDKFGIADQLPRSPLPFPSVVVASSNDPWMSLWKAAEWADRWGADLVNLGEAGHINAESGFGAWSEGLALFDRLRRRAEGRGPYRTGDTHNIVTRRLQAAWRRDWVQRAARAAGEETGPRRTTRLGVG
jgi:hypothetical protein